MSIVLQIYPNGEFSHGVDTSKQRRDKRNAEIEFKPPLDKERRDEYLRWLHSYESQFGRVDAFKQGDAYRSPNGYIYLLQDYASNHCTLRWEDGQGNEHYTTVQSCFSKVIFQWRLTPLVYQSVESSDKPESRKKLLSMTKAMSRNIRNAVYLMEQQPGGKDVLSFLTLTLPNLNKEDLGSCCANWDKMVSMFLDWLKVTVRRKGVDFQYVYCTEIQTKRLELRHEYAPHLHIVFKGRNGRKTPWVITPKQARKAWSRAISRFVDNKFNDCSLENLQRVKFSAARYLSKYISKGACSLPNSVPESDIQRLRTQWGGMARSLSQLIRKTTTVLSGTGGYGSMAMGILRHMEALVAKGIVTYYKRGFISLGFDKSTGLEYGLHVGCGCLSTPSYAGGFSAVLDFLYREFPYFDRC